MPDQDDRLTRLERILSELHELARAKVRYCDDDHAGASIAYRHALELVRQLIAEGESS